MNTPYHPVTHEPKVTVKVSGQQFNLYGRNALAFLAWWRSPPVKPKVEFYQTKAGERGYTFQALHAGARGAYLRTTLVVKTNVPA